MARIKWFVFEMHLIPLNESHTRHMHTEYFNNVVRWFFVSFGNRRKQQNVIAYEFG